MKKQPQQQQQTEQKEEKKAEQKQQSQQEIQKKINDVHDTFHVYNNLGTQVKDKNLQKISEIGMAATQFYSAASSLAGAGAMGLSVLGPIGMFAGAALTIFSLFKKKKQKNDPFATGLMQNFRAISEQVYTMHSDLHAMHSDLQQGQRNLSNQVENMHSDIYTGLVLLSKQANNIYLEMAEQMKEMRLEMRDGICFLSKQMQDGVCFISKQMQAQFEQTCENQRVISTQVATLHSEVRTNFAKSFENDQILSTQIGNVHADMRTYFAKNFENQQVLSTQIANVHAEMRADFSKNFEIQHKILQVIFEGFTYIDRVMRGEISENGDSLTTTIHRLGKILADGQETIFLSPFSDHLNKANGYVEEKLDANQSRIKKIAEAIKHWIKINGKSAAPMLTGTRWISARESEHERNKFLNEGILKNISAESAPDFLGFLAHYAAYIHGIELCLPKKTIQHEYEKIVIPPRKLDPQSLLNERLWSCISRSIYQPINDDAVLAALDDGADIESFIEVFNATPLWMAVYWGRTSTVRLLLQEGANVNFIRTAPSGKRISVLQLAEQNQLHTQKRNSLIVHSPEIVQILKENGARKDDGIMSTRLFIAARDGKSRAVVAALAADADINIRMSFGEFSSITPLCVAAYHGHLATVKVLLKKGAIIGIRNFEWQGLLYFAACSINDLKGREIIEFLFHEYPREMQKQLNVFTHHKKETPLHVAAAHNNVQTTKLLLELGADKTLRNSEGRTAEQLAEERNHGVLANFIKFYVSEKTKTMVEGVINPAVWSAGVESYVDLRRKFGHFIADSKQEDLDEIIQAGENTLAFVRALQNTPELYKKLFEGYKHALEKIEALISKEGIANVFTNIQHQAHLEAAHHQLDVNLHLLKAYAHVAGLKDEAIIFAKLWSFTDIKNYLFAESNTACAVMKNVVSLLNNSVNKVNLNGIVIGDAGASIIASILPFNHSVKEAQFDGGNITNNGFSALLQGLNFNRSIVSFDMSDSQIDDQGANVCAEFFRSNTQVIRFNLYSNRITKIGIRVLADMFKSNTTLLSFVLNNNSAIVENPEVLRVINESLERNSEVLANSFPHQLTYEKKTILSAIVSFPLTSKPFFDDSAAFSSYCESSIEGHISYMLLGLMSLKIHEISHQKSVKPLELLDNSEREYKSAQSSMVSDATESKYSNNQSAINPIGAVVQSLGQSSDQKEGSKQTRVAFSSPTSSAVKASQLLNVQSISLQGIQAQNEVKTTQPVAVQQSSVVSLASTSIAPKATIFKNRSDATKTTESLAQDVKEMSPKIEPNKIEYKQANRQ